MLTKFEALAAELIQEILDVDTAFIEKENYSVLRANLFLNATSNLILVKLDFL